jgi:hypothetical protein
MQEFRAPVSAAIIAKAVGVAAVTTKARARKEASIARSHTVTAMEVLIRRRRNTEEITDYRLQITDNVTLSTE